MMTSNLHYGGTLCTSIVHRSLLNGAEAASEGMTVLVVATSLPDGDGDYYLLLSMFVCLTEMFDVSFRCDARVL